ncbi:MAG: hypothetical protein KJ017_11930 [Alphaproteobacteria bacterium]|nr:hypothetical protein [Alphaproteobacteria bacterium]
MKSNYGKWLRSAALALLVAPALISAASAQPQPDPVAPEPAQSAQPAAMDRAAVEKFYQSSVAAQLAGTEETVEFIKKHADEKLSAWMKIISRVPGAPQAQTEEMTLDKRQLILKTKEGARTSRVQSLKTNLLAVKLSDDGKHAKVKNTSFGISFVRVVSPEGAMLMKAEQSMLCDDELNISPAGLIRFEKSRCNVEVVLEPKN